MGWNRALLTVCTCILNCVKDRMILLYSIQDSGGFQMVSLLKLAEITEVSYF